MKIAMVTAECFPYAKTGGLGDMVAALAQALRRAGHEVIVVLPKYASIDAARHGLQPAVSPMGVWMGERLEWCSVHVAHGLGLPVYFIEFDVYYGRAGMYHDADFNDHADNPRRFGFLARAALQLCRDLPFRPDVVHAHDWHAALACAYLKAWHWNDPVLGGAASLLTIHNVPYQGIYGAEHCAYLGLHPHVFAAEGEAAINFLRAGVRHADMANAVSPTYANQTRTPEHGHGLDPWLRARGDDYWGILNGVDYAQWDPAVDALIPQRYTPSDLAGKAECKRVLQLRFGLEVSPDTPVVGMLGRMVAQKGWDLLRAPVDGRPALDHIVRTMRAQFVFLGTGDSDSELFIAKSPGRCAAAVRGVAGRDPDCVGAYIGYDEARAHLIEAGADFFLMPSLYEPCGLNQMYSLKYGTPPIVRATGGLADSVEQYDQRSGDGTGFRFDDATPRALVDAVGWAVSTYYDRPAHLAALRQAGMARDFAWHRSVPSYEAAYERALANKRANRYP
jgi:starch synthase